MKRGKKYLEAASKIEKGKAYAIEEAVKQVLKDGIRTVDIMSEGMTQVGCKAMGDAICERI